MRPKPRRARSHQCRPKDRARAMLGQASLRGTPCTQSRDGSALTALVFLLKLPSASFPLFQTQSSCSNKCIWPLGAWMTQTGISKRGNTIVEL